MVHNHHYERHNLFQQDTGAEVTATTSDSNHLLRKPQLNAADKILCGPSRHPLGVLGKFECDLVSKTKVTRQEVFVVKGLKHNLLGLPAITALNLASRVDCTMSTNTTHGKFQRSSGDWETLEKNTTSSSSQMQNLMRSAH